MGIKVTTCNVPIEINRDVLAAYFSEYGGVENLITVNKWDGTRWLFCYHMPRERFQTIPHTIDYEDQVMMVVFEGRMPQCWTCTQLRYFARSCPQKTTKPTTAAVATATTTATTSSPTKTPIWKLGKNPQKGERWTLVTRKGGGSRQNQQQQQQQQR